MNITTPNWAKNAIFYQIFPDRFAKSQRTKHPRGTQFKPWGTPPEEQGYQGGDLYGILENLDYLQHLGINAIYLNPIFSSASNHRYHTFDFMQVDPLLGGDAALRALLDEAHRRDIKIILDGVFNHASRGFWAFHHILENGGNSPYIDWFHVEDWPLRPYVHDEHNPHNYKAWWNIPALPKFNTDSPGVRDYIYEVARHWLEFGIDGWRLDVPSEIDDDAFWQGFRQIVKETNPEAYIVGEIWEEAQRWLQGDQFDAVMNYLFADRAMSFFGRRSLNPHWQHEHFKFQPLDAAAFGQQIDYMHSLYDWEINHVQFNLLDSHDTARALWIMSEDKTALKQCALFQMTMPGAPCIYYGTEIGLSSAGDPHCREAFPWHDPDSWDNELFEHFRTAIELRHKYPALRTGSFTPLYAQGHVYAFLRRLGREQLIILFNNGDDPATIELSSINGAHQQVWPTIDEKEQPAVFHPTETGQLELEISGRSTFILARPKS